MSAPPYIAESRLQRLIFFTGKGGVGKTTVVWAAARALADQGRRVAVAAWSEADTPPSGFPSGVTWQPLNTLSCFKEYVLQVVKFEKLYETIFDNKVLRTFVLAAPGLSDTVIAGKLWDLYSKKSFDTILVDLPSSGHAISFFNSPLGVKRIFSVGFVHKETERICEMLKQSDVRVDLVALPEELPVVESIELKEKLQKLHQFQFGYLLMNQVLPDFKALRDALPADLPEGSKKIAQEYADQWKRQSSNLELARKAGMPIVPLPKVPSGAEATLVQSIAEELKARQPL